MEPDLGKLFIGGISWDTDEERLSDYFRSFGEVVESVIMKDRTTGRARGFGFIVFADPAVAERVVLEKHTIDGRVVEAKKAVPRDDQRILNRNSSGGSNGSPSPVPRRTKKIFVGGLASTVTESEFKKYFDQYGTITDVVVMYDHHTQRPRGFGFITFDTEDAVDKVLLKTFHDLNGKMVEVKRAVPKELSPGPSVRSPLSGYSYGLNRVGNILNGFAHGYNVSSIGGYGMRIDGRLGPVPGGRNGFNPFESVGYGVGGNYNPSMSPSLSGNMGNGNSIRGLTPYVRANTDRFGDSLAYSRNDGMNASMFSSNTRNVWGNIGIESSPFPTSTRPGSIHGISNNGVNWGSSSFDIADQGDRNDMVYGNGNLSYGNEESSYGVGSNNYTRKSGTLGINGSGYFTQKSSPYEVAYADPYNGDSTWQSAFSELDPSGPFTYGLDEMPLDNVDRGPAGYGDIYGVNNRQRNRGVAA